MELNKTMCRGYAEDNKIDIETLVSAKDYCQSVIMRYLHLLDKATFMPAEHIQKEREYGIIWRTAFKRELKELTDAMVQRCVSQSDGFTDKYDNEFHVLHTVIKTDAIDAATFDEMSQADLIHMLVENLEVLEKTTFTIQALLKEPEPCNFDEVKELILSKIKVEQKENNPLRQDTAQLMHELRSARNGNADLLSLPSGASRRSENSIREYDLEPPVLER